jgi:hypothetical protein
VAEEPAFLRGSERRRPSELERPADIVQEGRRHEQVGPKPGMHLGRVATDGRHGNGVLEQPTGVVVVDARARRELSEPRPEALACEKASDESL